MAGLEQLRRDARALESDIDAKLANLARLAALIGSQDADADVEAETATLLDSDERRVRDAASACEDALRQLSELVDDMSKASSNSGASRHTLQRHREILHDYTQEFRKVKRNAETNLEHAQLMMSLERERVRDRSSVDGLTPRAEQLLRERSALQSSERMTDDILAQASATKEQLYTQRDIFGNVGAKVESLRGRFPAVNSLIMQIQRRKLRDKLILGGVAGFCICVMILFR